MVKTKFCNPEMQLDKRKSEFSQEFLANVSIFTKTASQSFSKHCQGQFFTS